MTVAKTMLSLIAAALLGLGGIALLDQYQMKSPKP